MANRTRMLERGGTARNLLAMVVWQGANYLIPLLTFPYLTRVLHPAGFGLYGTYLIVGGWMTIFGDWGTNYTGSREVARLHASGSDVTGAFWATYSLRALLALFSLFSCAIYIVVVKASRAEAMLLLSAWTIAAGTGFTAGWFLQGLGRLDSFATSAVIGRVLTVPATFVLVRHQSDAWIAVAIQGAGGLIIALASYILAYQTHLVGRAKATTHDVLTELKRGFPLFLSGSAGGLYTSTATIYMNILHGPVATGLFVGADRLRQSAQNVIQPISQAFYPRIVQLLVHDKANARTLVRKILLCVALVMASSCIALAVLSSYIIRIVAGSKFADAANLLSILSIAIFVYSLNNVVTRLIMIPYGLDKYFARITVATAIVNVTLSYAIIYKLSAIGAALCVVGTEIILFTGYSYFVLSKTDIWLRGNPNSDSENVK